METYSVRFIGTLFKSHYERFAKVGIDLKSSEPSRQVGLIMTGQTVHTVAVEADSEEDAIETVERALGVDSFNFSDWEAGRVDSGP